MIPSPFCTDPFDTSIEELKKFRKRWCMRYVKSAITCCTQKREKFSQLAYRIFSGIRSTHFHILAIRKGHGRVCLYRTWKWIKNQKVKLRNTPLQRQIQTFRCLTTEDIGRNIEIESGRMMFRETWWKRRQWGGVWRGAIATVYEKVCDRFCRWWFKGYMDV